MLDGFDSIFQPAGLSFSCPVVVEVIGLSLALERFLHVWKPFLRFE